MLRHTVEIGGQNLLIETQELAKQADGAVLVGHGDTRVLVTAVAVPNSRPAGFLPLTVEYREKSAAAGSIPGGFTRREARLADHEIIGSRLIDRSLRPLFPKGYDDEIQIMASVLSSDPEGDPAILALIGAACALHISDIPWSGPVSAVRVVEQGGSLVVFPGRTAIETATLDMVVSSGPGGLVMVEGGAREVSSSRVLEALELARAANERLCASMDKLREEIGEDKRALVTRPAPELPEAALAGVVEAIDGLLDCPSKRERNRMFAGVVAQVCQRLADQPELQSAARGAVEAIRAERLRERTLAGTRVGGRGWEVIRDISGRTGWLPRTHGSAIFTRGETQAIVSCTLGTERDSQTIDTLYGQRQERFLLHYNFPPYSVGEVRPLRGPGRREIGHGTLARRALEPVVPDKDAFPYVIRLESDITESNGSSSMATVTGGCMALMDAGVPIPRPVAGIAMGLVTGADGRFVVLSDISGEEDHLGDMDFKLAGSSAGITAIQMDNKIGSLPGEVLEQALAQAERGIAHIIEAVSAIIDGTRIELAEHAPRFRTIRIRPNLIGKLIGPKGATITKLQADTGARIEVDDSGQVRIFATSKDGADRAHDMVWDLVGDLEVGQIYEGTITAVKEYGAFIRLKPEVEGLIHISELDIETPADAASVVTVGERTSVKVMGVDNRGRLVLSRREALP